MSANPTGPLHVGHARGAAYGDALARLLTRAGYDVTREFYINDRGAQMLKMGAVDAGPGHGRARARGRLPGCLHRASWADRLPDDIVESGSVEAATAFGYQCALEDQREVLAQLGVVFDVWFSEMTLVSSGAIEQTLADLRDARRGRRPRRRRVVPVDRLRRRQGPRAASRATASSRTCSPTSPTTATSSPAASTCSSTCGAPTTTATSAACAPPSRRSATSPTSSTSRSHNSSSS